MTKWISIAGGFSEADVIRWREAIYERRGSRGKSLRVGKRLVIAEVLKAADNTGWVHLRIQRCDVVSEVQGRTVRAMTQIGSNTNRKLRTIMRGKPDRLLWTDESARAIVASKFIGCENIR